MGWARIVVITTLSLVILSSINAMPYNQKDFRIRYSTLYVGTFYDFSDLNYFNLTNIFGDKRKILSLCFDSLLDYTPDFMIYNKLAENYQLMSEPEGYDNATVLVKLRRNVTFHDGVELAAKDVVFTYQVLYWMSSYEDEIKCLYWENATWNRWDFTGKSHIGVEAVDNYTVKFHLSSSYPLFFYVTLKMPIIPEHIWREHLVPAGCNDSNDMTIDTNFSEINATVGCGPFKVSEIKSNTYGVLEAYENYWGKDFTVSWEWKEWPFYPQYIEKIVFKTYGSLDIMILGLRSGEIDYILSSITPNYYEELKDDPRIGFEVNTEEGFTYLAFNMREEPLNNKSFRKAVGYCIDKDYIVNTLLHGYGIKGIVPIAITNPRYINESAIPPKFDLEKAKQILDQAGYKDTNGDGWRDMPNGSPIQLYLLTPEEDYDRIKANSAIMLSENLKSIGLNVEYRMLDRNTIIKRAFITEQFDMYIFEWELEPFPETYLYNLFHSSQSSPKGYNSAGYSNSTIDTMLEEMLKETDDKKRVEIMMDIEGILVEDLPYDTLYYRKNIEVYRQDRFQRWVYAFGTIFNRFSINTMIPLWPPPRIPEPSFLTADVGFDYINLTWQYENYENVTFIVYRSTNGKNFSIIGSVEEKLYYNDTNVSLGTKYWYYVRARKYGIMSEESNIINVTPGSPSPPTNVTAIGGNHYVNITWNPPEREGASPIISYKIYQVIIFPYKCPIRESWEIIYRGKVPYTQTYFNYTNVTNGRTYNFFVTALNAIGESVWSDLVSAYPHGPPGVVRNFKIKLVDGLPYLTWDKPKDLGGGYHIRYLIYRSTDGENFTLIAEVTDNCYHDRYLEEGKVYYYYVCALNEYGEGAHSKILKIYVPFEQYPLQIFSAWLIIFIIFLMAIRKYSSKPQKFS